MVQVATERRKNPRVPYGAWVEDLSSVGNLRFYLTRNLSLGGMLLQCEEPPPVGNKVRLRLVVENEKRTVTLEGQVVRHYTDTNENHMFAISFVNLDRERTAFLEELLKELMQNEEQESVSLSS